MQFTPFKMIRLNMIVILLISLTISQISAQNIKIIKVESELISESGIKNLENSYQDSVNTGSQILNIQLNLPVILEKDQTFLMNSITYLYYSTSYKDDMHNMIPSLHSIGYGATLLYRFQEKYSALLLFNPKISSDLKEKISSTDLTFNAGFGINWYRDKNFMAGLGLYYMYSYGKPLYFPIVNLFWIPAENIRVSMYLPEAVEMWYLPNREIELGIVAHYSSGQYHITELENVNYDYNRKIYFRYLIGRLGPQVNIRLFKSLYMFLYTGITHINLFEIFNEDGNYYMNGKYNLKNGLYFKAGLFIALPKEE